MKIFEGVVVLTDSIRVSGSLFLEFLNMQRCLTFYSRKEFSKQVAVFVNSVSCSLFADLLGVKKTY